MAKTRKKRKKASDDGILYIRGLPADVKDHFKSRCALRRISMNERIAQLIRQDIRDFDGLKASRPAKDA